MPETGGPVPAFAEAVEARDLDHAGALLDPGVQLSIPPLHYTRQGARDVLEGLAGLLGAFGELRYDVRGRYLAPAAVTDEAVLVGRQTGPFLGAAPNGRRSGVPVRVISEHDGARITRITAWPDLAAVRAAFDGAERVIDLTGASPSGGLIAALRAGIPQRQKIRIVLGTARQAPVPVPVRARPAGTSSTSPTVGLTREVPKPPVPKSVRQRRAVLAGGTMLVAAGALASWVAVGALTLPGSAPRPDARSDARSTDARPSAGTDGESRADAGAGDGGDGAAGAAGAAGANGTGGTGGTGTSGGTGGTGGTGTSGGPSDGTSTLAPDRQLAAGRNTVIIGSDLLFATDSADLTPRARRILKDLIAQARRQHRTGEVIVRGYTDDVGSTKYNLSLSRRRAASVAAALRDGLAVNGLTVRSRGHGEADPIRTNTTAVGRQSNRRVTVAFPPPTR